MGAGPAPGHTLGASCGRRRIKPIPRNALSERDTGMNTPTANRSRNTPELELSPMSRKVKHFDKYSRKGGRWSWKRPSYERGVVSLVKAERRIEEGIASALTEVEAVEAGLRYFDEIIMPESQKTPSRRTTEVADGSTNFRSQVPFSERRPKATRADGRLEAGPRGRQEGGFSKSQEERARDYAAARKTGVGRGSIVTSSSDRAVAECTDLKLTLKQRLDNYDRQRGINTDMFGSDSPTKATPVFVTEGEGNRREGRNHTDGSKDARGSRVPIAVDGSHKAREVNALAPCCDGGVPGAGGVGQILSRSLGKEAASVRRNKPTNGDSSIIGSSQHNGGSATRSRWKSWNEAPPPALLGAGGVRNLSATQNGDGRHRQHMSATGAISEVLPPASSRRRAEGVNSISASTSSTSALTVKSSSAVETSATPASSAKRLSVGGDKRMGASAGEVPPSAASSSSSRRSRAASGVPLVPRVAMLAAACATRSEEAEAAKKGKEFDPDQLECVRRHVTSMAERERRVRSMRSEAEKKTLFRARPLPAFLDGGGGVETDSDRRFLSSRGGSGARRKRDGAGQATSVGSGIAGSSPELLEALEQDEEARALVEKIRKINPRVDIASIVRQSTPRTPLPSQPTTRTSDGDIGVTPRPSFRGATAAGTSTVVTSASSARSMCDDAPPSLSVSTIAGGLQRTDVPGKQRSLSSSMDPDRATSSAVTTRSLSDVNASAAKRAAPPSSAQEDAEGRDYVLPVDESTSGPGNQTAGEVSRQEDQGEFAAAAAQEGEDGRRGGNGWIDQGTRGRRRRSLMGRMLESGMLERQKEWAKARRKKVLESRKQAEEAKEQEGKGDVMDTGLSSRSWSKAKTQHLRSLERQRQDEEEREAIREARRRASAFRAEKELESAERRAAEIVKNLAVAENAMGATTGIRVGRGGRAARSCRGGGGEARSRRPPPPPPRRATAHVGNGGSTGDAEGSGSTDIVARGDPRRRLEEDSPCRREEDNVDDPAKAVEADAHLSEDSFYRVAVEKIMEKERLGVGKVGGGGAGVGVCGGGSIGDDDGRRRRGHARRHGRLRKGTAGDPSILASPRGVAVGRRSRRKSVMTPWYGRKGDGANADLLAHTASAGSGRPLDGCPSRTQSYAAPAAPETHSLEGRSVAPSGSYSTNGVARTSSLLSLYEAQSVEYPNGHSDHVHLDNSGPYLDDGYANAPLDVGQSVFEPGAQAFTEKDWPDQGVRQLANPTGRDSQMAKPSAAGSAPVEAADDTRRGRQLHADTDENDFPWSDERRASRSTGSGGGVRRGMTGDDRIGVGSAATVDIGAPWENLLHRGEPHGHENDKGARRGEESARRQGWATWSSATASELSPQAVPPTGKSRQHGDSGSVLSQLSSRKRGPLDRRRTEGPVSSATASPRGAALHAARDRTTANRSVGEEQQQAPYAPAPPHGPSGGLDCDFGGAGLGVNGRFSLWSSSDEDATITEIDCDDEGDGERNRDPDGEFLVRAAVGGLGGNADADQHASRADNESDRFQTPERRAFLSAGASAGAFFDAATSSADKGRFKVRDPRLFDPCSMRRGPDVVGEPARSMPLASGAEHPKPTAFNRDGGKSTSVGVTLLLGCRADQRDADDAREQQPVDGGEQVITVMFDRSKYNEEEAERWWRANRVRIEGIGAPRAETGGVCKPSRGV